MKRRESSSRLLRQAIPAFKFADAGTASAAQNGQASSAALEAFVRELAISVARDAFAEAANATSGSASHQ
jgi:hypothetical protein